MICVGRAAVSIDRLIMRGDILRESTREAVAFDHLEVGGPAARDGAGTLRCSANPIEKE